MEKEENKLRRFLNGFTATTQLLHGFFVEYICLATSIVDGLLRIGLILKHQLETKSEDVLDFLLYQAEEDRIIAERKIYSIALGKGILSQDLFERLENLYRKRNRVIHRYIISDITTVQVLDIGIQYEKIISWVSDAVRKLEDMQIQAGVGMTVAGENTPRAEFEVLLDKMSAQKHGSQILADALRRENSI